MGWQIIDATVVPAPKQRNTECWKPAKVRQKDRDARWSIKYSKPDPEQLRHGGDDRKLERFAGGAQSAGCCGEVAFA